MSIVLDTDDDTRTSLPCNSTSRYRSLGLELIRDGSSIVPRDWEYGTDDMPLGNKWNRRWEMATSWLWSMDWLTSSYR